MMTATDLVLMLYKVLYYTTNSYLGMECCISVILYNYVGIGNTVNNVYFTCLQQQMVVTYLVQQSA